MANLIGNLPSIGYVAAGVLEPAVPFVLTAGVLGAAGYAIAHPRPPSLLKKIEDIIETIPAKPAVVSTSALVTPKRGFKPPLSPPQISGKRPRAIRPARTAFRWPTQGRLTAVGVRRRKRRSRFRYRGLRGF